MYAWLVFLVGKKISAAYLPMLTSKAREKPMEKAKGTATPMQARRPSFDCLSILNFPILLVAMRCKQHK